MCDLCEAGKKKIGPIDRQAAMRILVAADHDYNRPSVDDWPGYSPKGTPPDGYALALGLTKPTVVTTNGIPDGYKTALAKKAVLRG